MKKTKQIIAVILAAFMLTAMMLNFTACGEKEVVDPVYVTIANGELALTRKAVTLSDADGDGVETINDALILAHDAAYQGGAAAGFASADTEYGKSITKLWGVESSSGYGYHVNNESAMSLADEVKIGDSIYAYVYTDTDTWSDTYCFFSAETETVKKGESLTLTLSAAAYDENWNPITVPVEGATILIDGKDSGVKTDANGTAVITLNTAGEALISASSSSAVLVPPVCVVDVQ